MNIRTAEKSVLHPVLFFIILRPLFRMKNVQMKRTNERGYFCVYNHYRRR